MAPVEPAPPRGRRVLLIEDNPDSLETLRLLMQVWGHQVEVAADGLEGVRKALGWRPDVAVVDIGLPEMDGLEVARRLRQALQQTVRLIALTAYSQPEDQRRALDAGFEFFLSKPADCDRLAQLVAG